MKLQDIDISRFDRQITLEEQIEVDKTDGGFAPGWSEYISGLWCQVRPWKAWNLVSSVDNREASINYLMFVTHYDGYINTDMRVKFGDDYLAVREIENVEGADWFTVLYCAGLEI